MRKYNVQNYIRYKEDLKASMPKDKFYDYKDYLHTFNDYTKHLKKV